MAATGVHGQRQDRQDHRAGLLPARGGATAPAFWIDANYLYAVDYERGVDILKFDPSPPVPSKAEFDASCLARLSWSTPWATNDRYFCRVAATGGQ
jgi:hypothetical protein